MKIINKTNILLVIIIGICLGVIGFIFPKEKSYIYLLMIILSVFIILIFIQINRKKIDKFIIILFFLCVPFMTELNLCMREDFHIVAKQYYRFNYLHLFTVYFLIEIIRNIKKIRFKNDMLFLLIFNVICIISIIGSRNYMAGIQDYFRYFNISIAYIYFSRIFNFSKYKDVIYKCLCLGVGGQLILGLLQKIKGGRLGLSIIGEGNDVFRLGVEGYEKGLSGTFSHPGPLGLYCNFILAIFIFNTGINKKIRNIAVIISSIIIVLSAGRTSILIMIGVYVVYYIYNFVRFNIKNLILGMLIVLMVSVAFFMFNNRLEPVISRFVNSDMDDQYENRLSHVEVGLKYIQYKPLKGLGLNNYLDNTLNDYPSEFYSNFLLWNPIHNMYIQYAVEIGIIGISILMVFIFNFFIIYIKLRSKLSTEQNNICMGILLSIVVWLIYGLQGWGGIQTRNILFIVINCSVISNIYIRKNM